MSLARGSVGRILRQRTFCTSTFRLKDRSRPPPPIEDSTSALDYKSSQRRYIPPPLPETSLPRSRTAEEAVTNILYNTPPPSNEPFKKHTLNCLVQNEPGVLSRVSGILAGRGFNIDSLVVCRTEIRDLSRMCIVISGQDGVVEQARRQLEDLVPVWAVLDYTNTRTINRELALVKLSVLGPEYLEDQLQGGPTHQAKTFERETTLAHNFESSANPHPDPHAVEPQPAISPKFGAKIVDVSENSVIVEMSGKTTRVNAFLSLVKPFGILESTMVMPRTPISASPEDTEPMIETSGPVDPSLLPPG
ncbi:Acetolactate synthase [Rhizoctonia solani]|uniref:Acetolactate synthase n=1 Tax=Rhizoctonia solani TaxID=456999 RepID=A0A8H7I512_9AGAM|nr:Acetolactate synthase [Rhizoctonia solani]